MQRFDGEVRLRVRAHRRQVAVRVRPIGRWRKSADAVIDGYHVRLLAAKEALDKLLHVVAIAVHFEAQIDWQRYQLLTGLLAAPQLSVDFVKGVLLYGVHVRRVYDFSFDGRTQLGQICRKIVDPVEKGGRPPTATTSRSGSLKSGAPGSGTKA